MLGPCCNGGSSRERRTHTTAHGTPQPPAATRVQQCGDQAGVRREVEYAVPDV